VLKHHRAAYAGRCDAMNSKHGYPHLATLCKEHVETATTNPSRRTQSPSIDIAFHYLRSDAILDILLTGAGSASANLSLSAVWSAYQTPKNIRADVPCSLSNPIVISSCSLGYSGVSRQTKSLVWSSSPFGKANLASAKHR